MKTKTVTRPLGENQIRTLLELARYRDGRNLSWIHKTMLDSLLKRGFVKTHGNARLRYATITEAGRQALRDALAAQTDPCPHCQGSGRVARNPV